MFHFLIYEQINSKLFDKKSKETLANLYSIFIDDSQLIKKESLKQICEQIGRDYTFEEFQNLILNEK